MTELERLIREQAHDDRYGHHSRRYGGVSTDAPLYDDSDATALDFPAVSIFEAVGVVGSQVPRYPNPRELDVAVSDWLEYLEARRRHLAGPWRRPRRGPFSGRLARPRGTGRPRMLECSQGHEMTPENTRTRRIRNRPHPVRECWTCIREKRRAVQATDEWRKKHAEYERARRARVRSARSAAAEAVQ